MRNISITTTLLVCLLAVSMLTSCLPTQTLRLPDDDGQSTFSPTTNPVSSAASKITKPQNRDSDPQTIYLTYGDWEPYTGPKLPHYGCDAWVVSEAFAQQGYAVSYGYFPWKRAYELAKEGAWDGTIEWADTPDHREHFYLSAAYLSPQRWVFFYRKETAFDWDGLSSLAGKTIGVTSGYVYSDAFEEIKNNGTVDFQEAPSDEINMRKLLLGRIDVFPLEQRVGDALLERRFSMQESEQITSHLVPFQVFYPYLLMTKTDPENAERVAAFDRGFESLRKSGRYDEIMNTCAPRIRSLRLPMIKTPTLDSG